MSAKQCELFSHSAVFHTALFLYPIPISDNFARLPPHKTPFPSQ